MCVSRKESHVQSTVLYTVTRDGFGDEAKSVTPGLPTVQFGKQSNARRWEGLERGYSKRVLYSLGCAYGT